MNDVYRREQLFGSGLKWARECRSYLECMWSRRKLRMSERM